MCDCPQQTRFVKPAELKFINTKGKRDKRGGGIHLVKNRRLADTRRASYQM